MAMSETKQETFVVPSYVNREEVQRIIEENFPTSYWKDKSPNKKYLGEPTTAMELILLSARSMQHSGGLVIEHLEHVMTKVCEPAFEPGKSGAHYSPLNKLERGELLCHYGGKIFLTPEDTVNGQIARETNSRWGMIKSLAAFYKGMQE